MSVVVYSGEWYIESLVFTCAESEEEAQVWSAGQQTVDSHGHPPVPLVDQFAAEVLVDLARDSDIWRRPGATAGRHWWLVVDRGEQRRVEVATVVLLDEVVSRTQGHESFVDGQQRNRCRQLDSSGSPSFVLRQSLIQRVHHLRSTTIRD